MKLNQNYAWRSYAILASVIVMTGLAGTKLFGLQIINHQSYQAWAQDQHQLYEKLMPSRGEIFMQDKYGGRNFPVALNRQENTLYAIPRQLQESSNDLSASLADILKIPVQDIQTKITKQGDPFEIIKNRLTKQEVDQVKGLNCSALGFLPTTVRYYPAKNLASQVIGFVGYDGDQPKGQYGIEGYYNNDLQGEPGVFEGEKDTAGQWINLTAQKIVPARDGADLVLTLDQGVQFMLEEKLQLLVEKWQAQEGLMIVMEPKTGAIRGLANWPTFDLNQYSQVEDFDIFLNAATQKLYEPGSIFKPIVMAAGLAEGKIRPDSTYTDKGFVEVGNRTIHNAQNKSYGLRTMTQVLELSLNTGAVYVQQKIGEKIFLDYIKKFGLDQKTGVDLSGERAGDIANLLTGRPINLATASFGQGIAVTPLGLISAIGAIANQGKLMRPYLVEEKITVSGEHLKTEPIVRAQVISPEVGHDLTEMLVSSVEKGFAKQGGVAGYQIAGKTGTAQISDPEGGYYEERALHSFIGYAPADDPRFIVLIILDSPQGVSFASTAVAPAFSEIAKYLFEYYNIPSQNQE